MSWLSVRVRPSAAPEAVLSALFELGSQGVQEERDTLVTHFPADVDVGALRRRIVDADPRAEVNVSSTPDVDWSRAWRAGARAHHAGRLTIAPPWLAAGLDAATTVVIDPGMAFGTGEHATTRGVVRLLGDAIREGDSVADLGAGSAVLSIAAAKLGAGRVVAIEADPDAIANAEENVELNCVGGSVSVLCGDAAVLLPLVAPVTLVLANIISSVLVELLPAIAASLAAGGRAIMSGILSEERADMLAVLESDGWRIEAEDREDIWWSVRIARQ